MSEDTLLIQQTLAGDEQAFHRLSVKYQSAIYSLILSYVKNPDDAQEIMQDVFLKAYQGLSSLKQSERFRFWLYQLARNHCQDWKRKNQAEFQQLTDKTADGAYPADELLILRETLAKTMQAIDELPETEKRILKERYLDDSSYTEMQAKHGLSYKALNMRLLRAKQKVRARVEKLLAGIGIFSWHDALKKMLSGGVEAVKISAKVKMITIGATIVLVLGGTGIVVWHFREPNIKAQDSIAINQTDQGKTATTNYNNQPSDKNNSINNLSEKQKIEQINNAISYLDSLEKSSSEEIDLAKSGVKTEKAIPTDKAEEDYWDRETKAFMADMVPVAEGIDKEIPKRMVEGFFEALINKDFATANKIAGTDGTDGTFRVEDSFYPQIVEFTVGEPFQKEGRKYAGGNGLFVPYEFKLSSAETKKWHFNLRFDPNDPNKPNEWKWHFDGGM
jgi:RNA polymerase sigma factor (sigma-70 family)